MARGTQANGRPQSRATHGPSQSQHARVPTRVQDSEHEDEDEEGEEEEGEGRDRSDDDADNEIVRKANALVRLALFNESRRVPLRRDEINKRVLGENTRTFKFVFAEAQKRLQATFGMEMVELASRGELEKERNANDEVTEDANATGLKKKSASVGSKSYILRSTLHSSLIEAAASTDEQILEEEFNEGADDDDDEVPRTYGSIISWSSADQLGGLGLLYVILALILVHGHALNDLELRKHLKNLRSPMDAVIEFAPHSTTTSMTIENYLYTFIRQGYLDKVKISLSGAPRPTQGKRARANDAEEEGVTYEWRWGTRAQAEVGEQAIAQFVAGFTVERMLKAAEQQEMPESDDDGGTRRRRKRTQKTDEELNKMLENVMKDITRAAGGKLDDIRI